MAKYDLRIQARKMREGGESIVVISRQLEASKSTISLWCRDIILTSSQFEKLRKNKGVSVTTGQRMGAEANKRKKLEIIESANEWARKTIREVSKRDMSLVASALYWCEGSKSESTSTFVFVNSDPQMVLFMKNFLISVMDVPQEDLVCGIQINEIHRKRIDKVLIFWKKLLNLDNSQIRKPYFVKTQIKKIYDNYDTYFGVCRLFVRRGKHLKYKMLGLVESLKRETMSG
ncbi:MAG: hypothetical protein HYS51_02350 [Candidatus Zambryskibacteria bacterium]|nr:hypothetical protein [Candidatus Zambryskibacteria bacterium]